MRKLEAYCDFQDRMFKDISDLEQFQEQTIVRSYLRRFGFTLADLDRLTSDRVSERDLRDAILVTVNKESQQSRNKAGNSP